MGGPGHTHMKKHNKSNGKSLTQTPKPSDSDGTFIATIVQNLGSKMLVYINSMNVNVQANIPGGFRSGPRKTLLKPQDVVLIEQSLCYTMKSYNIIYKYSQIETKDLQKQNLFVQTKQDSTEEASTYVKFKSDVDSSPCATVTVVDSDFIANL
jgi:hypothetical protein